MQEFAETSNVSMEVNASQKMLNFPSVFVPLELLGADVKEVLLPFLSKQHIEMRLKFIQKSNYSCPCSVDPPFCNMLVCRETFFLTLKSKFTSSPSTDTD